MSALGFIGLGQMGAPIAGHLVDWPDGLVVCDIRAEATKPFADRGALVADDPAAVARAADVISVMVRDDDEVRDVVARILEASRPGTVVAVHSTIRPDTAVQLAETAAPHDVTILDGPVTGGPMGAARGTLAVLAGGDAAAVERCRDPFSRWATAILHLGPIGAGTRAKLALNLSVFVAYSGVAEAQRLAEAAGLDLTQLAEIVRHQHQTTGGPAAIMLRNTTSPLRADDPLHAVLSHTRDLAEKDLRQALELGRQLEVDLPFAQLALERFGLGLGLAG